MNGIIKVQSKKPTQPQRPPHPKHTHTHNQTNTVMMSFNARIASEWWAREERTPLLARLNPLD